VLNTLLFEFIVVIFINILRNKFTNFDEYLFDLSWVVNGKKVKHECRAYISYFWSNSGIPNESSFFLKMLNRINMNNPKRPKSQCCATRASLKKKLLYLIESE
jgi:hypothetical protein